MIDGVRLREVPHAGSIGASDDKPGRPQLLGVLCLCHMQTVPPQSSHVPEGGHRGISQRRTRVVTGGSVRPAAPAAQA